MSTLEGRFDGSGLRFGVVASRFNDLVTRRLVAGARDGLQRHGVAEEDVDVAWVPGVVEIPLAARTMATGGAYAAVITLGTVIRGATSHYDHVCNIVASGVGRAALDGDAPVIFGVLTTDTLDQALERAGSKAGNKGFDAALAALEMATLMPRLRP